jgi:hypothetical protein
VGAKTYTPQLDMLPGMPSPFYTQLILPNSKSPFWNAQIPLAQMPYGQRYNIQLYSGIVFVFGFATLCRGLPYRGGLFYLYPRAHDCL